MTVLVLDFALHSVYERQTYIHLEVFVFISLPTYLLAANKDLRSALKHFCLI